MIQPLQDTAQRMRVTPTQGIPYAVDADEYPKPAMIALIPDLRRYARFLVRDAAGTHDIVQETLVRALSALPQFRHDANLRGWLFTIQRNLLL